MDKCKGACRDWESVAPNNWFHRRSWVHCGGCCVVFDRSHTVTNKYGELRCGCCNNKVRTKSRRRANRLPVP